MAIGGELMRGVMTMILSLACATPALAADVTVTLTGAKAKGGTIRVSLFDDATFLRAHAPFLADAKGDKAGDVTVTFTNVPPGDYAVAALHDADNNEGITMAPDGRMGEGTALSNAEKLRGAPTFAVAKVAIRATGAKLTLPMSYPEDRQGW